MKSIMILPKEKRIGIYTSVPVDDTADNGTDHPFIKRGLAVGDGLHISFAPQIDSRGGIHRDRFFVVTGDDIIEGEGIGLVWRDGGDVDGTDLERLKGMVVWERV